MKKQEIEELMRLKGWSMTRLAAALDLSEGAVRRWFNDERMPGGPACIVMRLWLREARGEIRIVEVAPAAQPVAV